jgi:hypothetical protein
MYAIAKQTKLLIILSRKLWKQKYVITDIFPWIPWKILRIPKGFANNRLGAIVLDS